MKIIMSIPSKEAKVTCPSTASAITLLQNMGDSDEEPGVTTEVGPDSTADAEPENASSAESSESNLRPDDGIPDDSLTGFVVEVFDDEDSVETTMKSVRSGSAFSVKAASRVLSHAFGTKIGKKMTKRFLSDLGSSGKAYKVGSKWRMDSW